MNMRCGYRFLGVVIAIGFFPLTFGGANRLLAEEGWTSIGPWSGKVYSLAIDPTNPQTLYACTNGGILKSTNGGGSWFSASSGLPDKSARKLVMCTKHPETIYALGNGVFKTTNGGMSWTKTDFSFWGTVIAVDPVNPDVAFVATWEGCYKTSDGGVSWQVLEGLTSEVNAIAVDPKNHLTVYVGMYFGGHPSFPSATPDEKSKSVGASHGALQDIGSVFSIYKSEDGGMTWSAISAGIPEQTTIQALAIDQNNTNVIYAAQMGGEKPLVYKTNDGGVTWNQANTGLPNGWQGVSAFAFDPTQSGIVYAVTHSGVFRTTNGGEHWNQIKTGLFSNSVETLAIDPSDGRNLYVGTEDRGLLKSNDRGASFCSANRGIATESVTSIAVSPTNPLTIYAGRNYPISYVPGGVLKTTDGGASWTTQGGTAFYWASAITLDPMDSRTAYVVSNQVHKTINSGASWKSIWNAIPENGWFNVNTLAIDPTNPQTVYVGISYNGYPLPPSVASVYKTTDGGMTWTGAGAGLSNVRARILAIDPSATGTVYLGGTGGVFKSLDGGLSWNPAWMVLNENEGVEIVALAIDPKNPQTLFAGVGNGNNNSALLYKTTDGGSSWAALKRGLPGWWVTALAIDPVDTQTVYAGTYTGVFKSTDGGANWSAFNDGLSNLYVNSLAIDPTNPQRLYAGTNGGGIFVYGGLPTVSPTLWIPVVSHGQGLFDSTWRTDLGLLNPGQGEAHVSLTLHAPDPITVTGPLPSRVEVDPVRVPPGSQIILKDIVDTLRFSGNASLEINSDQPIRASSRTYGEVAPGASCYANGTSGQYYPASTSDVGLKEGESVWLPGLIDTRAFRSNIAITNTGTDPAMIQLALFDGEGTTLTNYNLMLAPGEFHQENRPFAGRARQTNLTRGYATIKVTSGRGILVSASVVDNLTNDPATIAAVRTDGGARLDTWVQVASHTNGVAGSVWRTDLGILNPNPGAVHITVSFYSNGTITSSAITVPPGVQHMLADVVSQLGVVGNGALRVVADRGVVTSSRTYSVVAENAACLAGGTFGQGYDGSHVAGLLDNGESGYLPHLRENAAFRTNLAFTNTGNAPASVMVELLSGAGAPLTNFNVDLAPGQFKLETRPFAIRAGLSNLDSAWARVSVTSGDGVLVSASLIDNITNDPSTIPIVR